MIDNLAVIEESHLNDPDGNVERRLAMYSRNDVLQIKELEDILAAPSPKPSAIVRNWPEKMWCRLVMKEQHPDGRIAFCGIGVLYEVNGGEWGEPNRPEREGIRRWQLNADVVSHVTGLNIGDMLGVSVSNDGFGKEAAAAYLESIGK